MKIPFFLDNKFSPEDETNPKEPVLAKVHLDEWLHIVMEKEDADQILKIRYEMNKVFLKMLKTPKSPLNQVSFKVFE